ncbi:hypothetical protein [Nocardia terpenica]|uniref:Uncharacterized protein n=1 Tax=Nocardia terpenica TaxID=455432 RepID=A0A164H036_9NOCA|nr:hypothetical protein [Nocardia terpenica]KZM68089.1 hypothetical protein AWN90_09105 [Nocardia terpenica]NQE89057.1 hypothetical protein [Nocardia terpenica]
MTDRATALGASLARIGDIKAELIAELADSEQMAADLVDADLIALELEEVRRDAEARVAEALAAQAAAERDALAARRERDDAFRLRQAALDAAEEAIAVRDGAVDAVTRMRTDCDQEVARVFKIADTQVDRARAAADREIAELKARLDSAEEAKARAESDRDQMLGAVAVLRTDLQLQDDRHREELAAVRSDCQRHHGAILGSSTR